MSREVVDAIMSGDNVAAREAFNDAMAAKVTDALDAKRVEVAQSMTGGAGEQE